MRLSRYDATCLISYLRCCQRWVHFACRSQSTWTKHREEYFTQYRIGLVEWMEYVSSRSRPSAVQRNETISSCDCGGWRRLWFLLKCCICWPIHAWTPYIMVESRAVDAALKSLAAFDELFATEVVPSLKRHFQIKDTLTGWWWHLRSELIGTGCRDSGERWPTASRPADSLSGGDLDRHSER
jgi:hypothetical protein